MDRVPVACALVAAVLLVSSPLYVLPHASSPAYRHTVQQAAGGGAAATAYADLPARARRTFDAARSAGGAAVERTTDPAFEVGRTVVATADGRYVVATVREPPSTALRWLKQSLTTFGAVLFAVAGVALRGDGDRTARLPVGFAVVGLGAVVAAAAGVRPAEGTALLVAVVGTQFVALWWAVAAATGRIVPRPLTDD
jgi:hypothetical protein